MKLQHPNLPDVEIDVSPRAAGVLGRSGWTEVPEKHRRKQAEETEVSSDDESKEK